MVFGVVATDPHVAFRVDVDAVFVGRPVVADAGAAPGLDNIAGRIKFNDGGCGPAATGGRRIFCGACFKFVDGARPVDDPQVVALVDMQAGHLSQCPLVGQGFGPERVDAVAWRRAASGVVAGCRAAGQNNSQ